MKLTEDVRFIIERLEAQGFRADIVGGPVRDFLLGKAPDDYDITTSANPEEMKKVFSDKRTIDTGIKHGTVTLMLDGEPYEITTYRIDGEYKDSRHPETVSFTTLIEEDLSRRDFTMNAIAYSEKHGITDPFGGAEDIKKRLIRTVGDPKRRFSEDALRILRGIRFAARLGFEIHPETKKAMHELCPFLRNISAERIYSEWQKLLSGDFSQSVLSEFSDIISIFLPEIAGVGLPTEYKDADYMTRLVALFYRASRSCDEFKSAMKRLKTDTHTCELGAAALSAIDKFDRDSMNGISRLLNFVGKESASLTLSVEKLLCKNGEQAQKLLSEHLSKALPYRISDLRIDGNDLKNIGASGREIGRILGILIDEVIDGKLENNKPTLLNRAKELLTK